MGLYHLFSHFSFQMSLKNGPNVLSWSGRWWPGSEYAPETNGNQGGSHYDTMGMSWDMYIYIYYIYILYIILYYIILYYIILYYIYYIYIIYIYTYNRETYILAVENHSHNRLVITPQMDVMGPQSSSQVQMDIFEPTNQLTTVSRTGSNAYSTVMLSQELEYLVMQ